LFLVGGPLRIAFSSPLASPDVPTARAELQHVEITEPRYYSESSLTLMIHFLAYLN